MLFGLIKRKDPVCGMKEEKGKGTEKYSKWFCNSNCVKEYEKQLNEEKVSQHKDCCH